jgi:hypothetical protein
VKQDGLMQQVARFKYLGCYITYELHMDTINKLYAFQVTYPRINMVLERKSPKDTQLMFIILWQYHDYYMEVTNRLIEKQT